MLNFKRWNKQQIKKKKGKVNEPRCGETHGEIGHVNQQREVAGGNQTEPSKAIFIFPVPEQR
jgi:hypothetical protein